MTDTRCRHDLISTQCAICTGSDPSPYQIHHAKESTMKNAKSTRNYALRVTDEEKRDLVFDVLASDMEPHTMTEIVEETGLSPAQARLGWKILRHELGHLCIVDPPRGLYYLSEEVNDRGWIYMFWQIQHNVTRLRSAWHSAMQGKHTFTDGRSAQARALQRHASIITVAFDAVYAQGLDVGNQMGWDEEYTMSRLGSPNIAVFAA